jgi:hypothetical protein
MSLEQDGLDISKCPIDGVLRVCPDRGILH